MLTVTPRVAPLHGIRNEGIPVDPDYDKHKSEVTISSATGPQTASSMIVGAGV